MITHTYDWSGFTHLDMFSHLPVLDREKLRRSLDKLAQAVEV